MRRIFWDTMLYAYWFEGNTRWGRRVGDIHAAMERRGDVLCSNLFVLGELLVGPLKMGETQATSAIEEFFRRRVTLLPYGEASVRIFAGLRAHQGIKSLDALHLATAATAGVDAFITNDHRLEKAVVPGVSFILPLEAKFF